MERPPLLPEAPLEPVSGVWVAGWDAVTPQAWSAGGQGALCVDHSSFPGFAVTPMRAHGQLGPPEHTWRCRWWGARRRPGGSRTESDARSMSLAACTAAPASPGCPADLLPPLWLSCGSLPAVSPRTILVQHSSCSQMGKKVFSGSAIKLF